MFHVSVVQLLLNTRVPTRGVPDSVHRTWAIHLYSSSRREYEREVALLDLKPLNIAITATKQLQITDFSAFVLVSEPESWVVGYRGTEGWVAPELEMIQMKSFSQFGLSFGSGAGIGVLPSMCRRHIWICSDNTPTSSP